MISESLHSSVKMFGERHNAWKLVPFALEGLRGQHGEEGAAVTAVRSARRNGVDSRCSSAVSAAQVAVEAKRRNSER